MLQILFAVILLELKCILYLCRQGYLLSPRFCSEEHSVTSTAVRTAAQHIRCVADSQGKHSFEVLSIGGLQAHQESWIAENKVQTTCKPFSAFQASAQGSRCPLQCLSLSLFPIQVHKGSVECEGVDLLLLLPLPVPTVISVGGWDGAGGSGFGPRALLLMAARHLLSF